MANKQANKNRVSGFFVENEFPDLSRKVFHMLKST